MTVRICMWSMKVRGVPSTVGGKMMAALCAMLRTSSPSLMVRNSRAAYMSAVPIMRSFRSCCDAHSCSSRAAATASSDSCWISESCRASFASSFFGAKRLLTLTTAFLMFFLIFFLRALGTFASETGPGPGAGAPGSGDPHVHAAGAMHSSSTPPDKPKNSATSMSPLHWTSSGMALLPGGSLWRLGSAVPSPSGIGAAPPGIAAPPTKVAASLVGGRRRGEAASLLLRAIADFWYHNLILPFSGRPSFPPAAAALRLASVTSISRAISRRHSAIASVNPSMNPHATVACHLARPLIEPSWISSRCSFEYVYTRCSFSFSYKTPSYRLIGTAARMRLYNAPTRAQQTGPGPAIARRSSFLIDGASKISIKLSIEVLNDLADLAATLPMYDFTTLFRNALAVLTTFLLMAETLSRHFLDNFFSMAFLPRVKVFLEALPSERRIPSAALAGTTSARKLHVGTPAITCISYSLVFSRTS
mmetsp:Transcript_66378/g.209923  ORF Transcript_66378/g.209923 Transcript_66378/m.209923 type:complete len:476 (+) Transcript_66378:1798-3225(+)